MQFTSVLTALGALFAATASAQQFAGDVIDTNLPNVPGAEIAYFKIPGVQDSNSKKSANLTLINYMSYGSNGKRLVGSKVQRAVIIVHGLNRDPGTYESNMLSALAQVKGDPNINRDSVAVMAPYFPNGDDKGKGYPWTDGLKPQRGSTTSALVWKSSQWSAGANNQYPYYSQSTSSYTVLDTLVQYFDDRTLFPNMKQIVVAGHSLGAQTVQRYAAIGKQLGTQSPVTYWIGNPNSYVWLDSNRPLSTTSCPEYDFYRDGYTNFTEYPMTYGQSLVSSGRQAIIANYQSKQIAYARGTQDKGDDSSTCAPFTTGGNRHERFFNFIKAFPASCADPKGGNCDTVDFVNMGHDAGGMMASSAGLARLFTDNFYGNGNRSYDFGYPRLEAGDDPFPDPSLNSTTSSVNNNTYAGNMTYGGCWSDTGSTRALSIMAYDNAANTIETCTDTCAQKGYSIAGLEFGSQCYCGNELKYGTTKVIENSCTTACSGNSTQICGNNQRLSIFSNGAPYVLAPASSPEQVGKFFYSNCYTDTSPRTLSGKFTSGSFMTLDWCANYCSGYKYFGTEYSSECYCGNTINAPAQIATSSDCSFTCANNTLQYCGAGNRLTLYTNPDVADVPASSSTSSSSAPGATAGTGPSCPASDGTIVTSKGLNFTVECGIDHAGGDLTSQYVGSFQECIDACASNSQCVDVSLSGTACYLKKTLGAAGKSAAIWGAKLMTGDVSSSTVSSSTVSSTSQTSSGTSVSSQSSSGSSTVSSSSATSTPSNIACPSSDATTYVGASGRNFVIECGIDHQGGDLTSKYVDTFQQCIDACDQTTGCVDVSLSGTACYMKKAVGPAVTASYVWGARLDVSSSSSASGSASSTGSSSVASSSSSTSSTVSQSSTSVSSSASASATAVNCPDSDATTYTLASGASFLIECGIDHQGGDLTSKSVKSFAECIAACDTTTGCVDVSLSGDMCYMKNAVGAAVKASWISGAKLIPASSSSTSSSAGISTSSSTSSVSSSTSSDVSTSTSSSSSSSSSASAESTTTSSSGSSSSQSATTSSDSSISSSVSSSTSTSSEASLSSSTTTSSSESSVSSTSSTSSDSSSSATSQSTTSASSSTSSDSSTTSSSSSSSESTTSASSTSTSSSSSSSFSAAVSTSESTTSVSSTSSSSSSSSSSSAPLSTPESTTSASSTSTSSSSSSSSSAPVTTSSATTLSTAVSSSTSVSSSSVSSSAASLPSGFSYAGCFIDSSSQRALPVQIGTSTTQTQQQCAMSCQAKGYKYSGTEYANECWCGNSAPTSSAPELQCNMACKGDSTQKCGAGSRLSVVSDDSWKQTFFATQNSGAYNLMGCFTDSTAKRSLPSSVSLAAYGGGANATIANCMSACKARGFAYCGAEYYSECYGSNIAPATTLAGSEPLSAGCNYPCKGNSSESCGGSSRIIVYTTNLS